MLTIINTETLSISIIFVIIQPIQAPHVAADGNLLQEAYLLFHCFLTWPEPCFSASKRLLNIIQQELRAPGSAKASL